jgi:hypothetical protein
VQVGKCKCEILQVWGGRGGLGFGLVRNHVWTEILCLFLTMSGMGYITICPKGKRSCIQYPMG